MMLEKLLLDPMSDVVHLVPTGQNPLKSHEQCLKLEDRKALMDLWQKDLQKKLPQTHFDKLRIETLELDSDQQSYTVDLVHVSLKILSAKSSSGATASY